MNPALAVLLARLIAVGYRPSFISAPEETARQGCAEMGLEFVDFATGTDFKGYFGQLTVPYAVVAADPTTKQIYVAFRGTEDGGRIGMREWIEDLLAMHEPCAFMPGARCHRGLGDLYGTLVTSSGLPLADALATCRPVIAGHSLGGFLATALTAHLGALCTMGVSFNGGRFFDATGAQAMDRRQPQFYRYVVRGEPVHYLPPEVMGYRDAGVEIDLDPAGHVRAVPSVLHVLNTVQVLLGDPCVQLDPSSLP